MVIQRRSESSTDLTAAASSSNSASSTQFNEDSMCRIAKQVPKPKVTGNAAVDSDLQAQRRAYMKTIDYLWNHPEDRLRVWAYIEAPVEKQRSTSDKDWDISVAYISRLPKYWKAQWLVKQTEGIQNGFTQQMCDLIDSRDTSAIDKLFRMFTETKGSTKIPMPCRRSKDICARTFASRAATVAAGMHEFVKKFVKASGEIDWARGGAYRLKWAEGKATQVVYMNGDTANVMNDITKEFVIKDPWDHLLARADGPGAAKYQLADYFEAGTGPHKNILDKRGQVLDLIANTLQQQADEASKQLAANTFDEAEHFIGQAASELRKKRLQAAQKRAAESSKRRRLVRLSSR